MAQFNCRNKFDLKFSFFLNGDTGYVIDTYGHILKTINAGNSWIQHLIESNSLLNSEYFVADTGYVVGLNGLIMKTTNGGNNWNSTSSCTQNLYQVYFSNKNAGYVIGDNG